MVQERDDDSEYFVRILIDNTFLQYLDDPDFVDLSYKDLFQKLEILVRHQTFIDMVMSEIDAMFGNKQNIFEHQDSCKPLNPLEALKRAIHRQSKILEEQDLPRSITHDHKTPGAPKVESLDSSVSNTQSNQKEDDVSIKKSKDKSTLGRRTVTVSLDRSSKQSGKNIELKPIPEQKEPVQTIEEVRSSQESQYKRQSLIKVIDNMVDDA